MSSIFLIFSEFLSNSFIPLLGRFFGHVLTGASLGLGLTVTKGFADVALFIAKRFLFIVLQIALVIKLFVFLKPEFQAFSDSLDGFLSQLGGAGAMGQILLSFLIRYGLLDALGIYLAGYVSLFVFRLLFRTVIGK